MDGGRLPAEPHFAVTAEIVAAITSSRVVEEVLSNVARWTAETLHF